MENDKWENANNEYTDRENVYDLLTLSEFLSQMLEHKGIHHKPLEEFSERTKLLKEIEEDMKRFLTDSESTTITIE